MKYEGDKETPASLNFIELKVDEKNKAISTKGIKLKIVIDLDEK